MSRKQPAGHSHPAPSYLGAGVIANCKLHDVRETLGDWVGLWVVGQWAIDVRNSKHVTSCHALMSHHLRLGQQTLHFRMDLVSHYVAPVFQEEISAQNGQPVTTKRGLQPVCAAQGFQPVTTTPQGLQPVVLPQAPLPPTPCCGWFAGRLSTKEKVTQELILPKCLGSSGCPSPSWLSSRVTCSHRSYRSCSSSVALPCTRSLQTPLLG
jgi:hypothetical protein